MRSYGTFIFHLIFWWVWIFESMFVCFPLWVLLKRRSMFLVIHCFCCTFSSLLEGNVPLWFVVYLRFSFLEFSYIVTSFAPSCPNPRAEGGSKLLRSVVPFLSLISQKFHSLALCSIFSLFSWNSSFNVVGQFYAPQLLNALLCFSYYFFFVIQLENVYYITSSSLIPFLCPACL